MYEVGPGSSDCFLIYISFKSLACFLRMVYAWEASPRCTGLYLLGAGVSFGKSMNCLPDVPKVVLLLQWILSAVLDSTLTDPGILYAPGPGPSTLVGLKWSLFRIEELNLVPNEKIGAPLAYFALYVPGPLSSYV